MIYQYLPVSVWAVIVIPSCFFVRSNPIVARRRKLYLVVDFLITRFFSQAKPKNGHRIMRFRVLTHTSDKHRLNRNFKYICGIYSWNSSYTDLQSFHRHAKAKHSWFFDKHMMLFKNKSAP